MHKERVTETATRRNFLRGGIRYALLAGAGAVAVSVAGKPGPRLSGQTCVNRGVCRDCSVMGDCSLPQAFSFRQMMKGRSL
jgi:hypothetical protein